MDSTYWDSVIESYVEDPVGISPRNVFVAIGLDMCLVWSSIITELHHGVNSCGNDGYNTLPTEIRIPNHTRLELLSPSNSTIYLDCK